MRELTTTVKFLMFSNPIDEYDADMSSYTSASKQLDDIEDGNAMKKHWNPAGLANYYGKDNASQNGQYCMVKKGTPSHVCRKAESKENDSLYTVVHIAPQGVLLFLGNKLPKLANKVNKRYTEPPSYLFQHRKYERDWDVNSGSNALLTCTRMGELYDKHEVEIIPANPLNSQDTKLCMIPLSDEAKALMRDPMSPDGDFDETHNEKVFYYLDWVDHNKRPFNRALILHAINGFKRFKRMLEPKKLIPYLELSIEGSVGARDAIDYSGSDDDGSDDDNVVDNNTIVNK